MFYMHRAASRSSPSPSLLSNQGSSCRIACGFWRGVGQVEVERHGRGDWAKGEGALEGADKAPGTQSRGTGASERGRGLRQPASPAPESVLPEAVVLAVLWGGRRGIRDLQTCDPFRLHVQPSTHPSLAVRDFRVAVGPSWVGHMCQINERSAPHHQPGSPAHDPSTTASRSRSIAPGCHSGLAGPSAATRTRHSRQRRARRVAQRRQAWRQNVRRKCQAKNTLVPTQMV